MVLRRKDLWLGAGFFVLAFFASAFMPGLLGGGTAQAATCGTGNINSLTAAHWAWNDTLGWIDFCTPGNVTVSSSSLSGYASTSRDGIIALDCHTAPAGSCASSNYQVTNDGYGNLSGWAWNDIVGWISFDCHNNGTCGSSNYQVTIDGSGNFNGWAWNDVVGWIDFDCLNNGTCGSSNFYVNTTWLPATSTVGVLYSTPFDTNIASGAQLNSVLWYGNQPPGTQVQFQFAVSNSSSGPWTFTGPDGTVNTYFTPTPGTALPLSYGQYNNFRYFRYAVTLTATTTSTPRVDDVIVNWSP